MLITEGILLTAKICKSCFFALNLPLLGREGSTYKYDYVISKILQEQHDQIPVPKDQLTKDKEVT